LTFPHAIYPSLGRLWQLNQVSRIRISTTPTSKRSPGFRDSPVGNAYLVGPKYRGKGCGQDSLTCGSQSHITGSNYANSCVCSFMLVSREFLCMHCDSHLEPQVLFKRDARGLLKQLRAVVHSYLEHPPFIVR
jgi:hypothetical protein